MQYRLRTISLVILAFTLAILPCPAPAQDLAKLNKAVKAVQGTKNTIEPALSTFARALLDSTGKVVVKVDAGHFVFEGHTENAYQSTWIFAEPTADRSVIFPDAAGTLEYLNVVAKAATATLTAAECHGSLITNTGASGAIVLTLPTPAVGMRFRVYLTVAQDVDLNAATGTQILALTNATGDAISSAATIGNAIELVAVSATQWVAFSASGTWTDVN